MILDLKTRHALAFPRFVAFRWMACGAGIEGLSKRGQRGNLGRWAQNRSANSLIFQYPDMFGVVRYFLPANQKPAADGIATEISPA
jgi:hypothetical protein